MSYVAAQDAADADALWVTEVWERQASHQASLSLPWVQQAIAHGRPLIACFGKRFATVPVGGHALVDPRKAADAYIRGPATMRVKVSDSHEAAWP